RKKQNLSDLDSVILEYGYRPINAEGFRSIPFKQYKDKKIKVLLLGDSFTWGHTTNNKTSSFADDLLTRGYIVYNTGITGTDVAQYLAVARKYIPLLQPDVVIVNFYLGNDITYYKRTPKPHHPVFFATNANNLMAFQMGKEFDNADSAYANIIRNWSIPATENKLNWLLKSTCLTTLVWKAMQRSGYFPYLYKDLFHQAVLQDSLKYPYFYHNVELAEIKRIAEDHGAKFILSSLPEISRFKEKRAKDVANLFDTLQYVEMQVNKSDYSLGDAHFNEKGHARYAAFLDSLIKNSLKKANGF
ncbi:MAG: hypothetical protein NZ522_02790, partial [Chitinophagales bacterium]|nr:hypothetical protein [Chitinophagales bacterium]